MSDVSPPISAPLEVQSIHFNFLGGQAICLRDHVAGQMLGSAPEWDAGGRSVVSAYVRGTTPTVRVVFRGQTTDNGIYRIGATGKYVSVAESVTHLAFDPVTGLTPPIPFTFADALPDEIGRHQINFSWYILDPDDPPVQRPFGTTSHAVCTTWKAMVVNADEDLEDWVYYRLMEWTCRWARGQTDEKGICDALIRRIAESGLQYGVRRAWEVREILNRGGGMCGGWFQIFQQMAHAQGVFLYKRCFLVERRELRTGEEFWCALVVRNGGVNQPLPTDPPSDFHDHDGPFTGVAVNVVDRTERRYRFWGSAPPDYVDDGHCVNFLDHNGRLYLYDACFEKGPVEISGPLPPADGTSWGGAQLASFKSAYLDGAVDYMLGSVYNGDELLRSVRSSETNGLSVKTSQIPELLNGDPGLTFRWQ